MKVRNASQIFDIIGTNSTSKVRNPKKCFTMPAQITCAFLHYLAKWETQKWHFSLALLAHCQNLTSCCLTSVFHSRFILTLLCDSLNLVISAFSFVLLGGMVQEKGSREHCNSWTVLHAQCTSVLYSGFPFLQGNAAALDRWGGKTKHHCLISYFLSNTSAKNYHNRIVYVKIIASQRWTFFETRCI